MGNLEKYPEDFKIGTCEYGTAVSPDTLSSGGIGPCIVVGAIYEKKGYLAHYVPLPIFIPISELETLINDLRSVVKDKSRLKIFVAGGAFDTGYELKVMKKFFSQKDIDEEHFECVSTRKRTIDMIAEAGFSQAIKKIEWNKPGYIQHMGVIPDLEKIEIRSYEEPDKP
jgi:chemotaxis receptor (MCP) glutamine deamidase CheD